MEYKVLYRKYRPKTFDEVVGQKSVVDTLKNSIILNKMAHAYIFSGMRGTGKTSVAKIFAKTINCLNSSNGISCNECVHCLLFETTPDIIEIDAASNNGVDEIREIVSNSRIVPTSYKYKVYIIDEVHMLSTGAFNALLKTLEEPLDHVIFILATTDIQKVPLTILSRCQRFDFGRIDTEEMIAYLETICEKENIAANREAIEEIAYLSEGAMRDALSLLDQLSKQSSKITLELIEKTVGTVSTAKIVNLTNKIITKDTKAIIKIISEFKIKRYDVTILVKKLISELYKSSSNHKFAIKCLKMINESYLKILSSFDSYIELEIIILDLLDEINIPLPDVSLENELIKNVTPILNTATSLNEQTTSHQAPMPGSTYQNLDEIFSVRINNCFASANKEDLNEFKRVWQKQVSTIETLDISVYSLISEGQVVLCSKSTVVIALPTESEATLISNKFENIVEKLSDIDKKMAFISNNKWNSLKEKYIKDLKNKKEYREQPEPKLIKEEMPSDNFSDSAKELFGDENVDII